ncbi:MAG: NUDIX domain-containing protein [Nocardioides sp.]|nr:NUDIX domain-containing protein [Nocardioides sp.]
MEDASAAQRSSDGTDRFVAHGLVERGGRYLLLRRREGRYLGGQWDVPGGTVEPGESPAAAAVRECWEEAGLRVRAGAEVSHHRNRDTEGRDLVFHTLTYALEETGPPVEVRLSAHEHDAHRWATPQEAGSLPLVWHVALTLAALSAAPEA